jgi:hypothetical protein
MTLSLHPSVKPVAFVSGASLCRFPPIAVAPGYCGNSDPSRGSDMTRRFSLIMITAVAITACGRGGKTDDVLSGTQTTTVVYATTQCTVPNADGVRCDKKTCKEDARSNCASFSDRCTKSGHTYEGSDSAGTCIREGHVG